VNIGKSERSSSGKPPTQVGYSLNMKEMVDETLARAVIDLEYGTATIMI
jgi:hypothetical protein